MYCGSEHLKGSLMSSLSFFRDLMHWFITKPVTQRSPSNSMMDFSSSGFWHDPLDPSPCVRILLIMLSHHETSKALPRGWFGVTSICTTYPIWHLSLSVCEKWAFHTRLAVFIISKRRRWETLRGHVLSAWKTASSQTGLQSKRCSCRKHPRGGSRGFVGGRGGLVTPLCKQLTLMAMEGRVPGAVPMFPWHGALRPGQGGELDRMKKQRRDWSSNLQDSICRFLHSRGRRGRRGEPETGGSAPHQLAVQPASAHSQDNFPFYSSAQSSFFSCLFHHSSHQPRSSEVLLCFSLSTPLRRSDKRLHRLHCSAAAAAFSLWLHGSMLNQWQQKWSCRRLQTDVNRGQIRKRPLCSETAVWITNKDCNLDSIKDQPNLILCTGSFRAC